MAEILAIPSEYQTNLLGYGDILERHSEPVLEARSANETVLNGSVFAVNGETKLAYRQAGVQFGQPGEYESSIWIADSPDGGLTFEKRAKPLVTATELDEQGLGCEDPRVAVSLEMGKTVLRMTYNAARLDREGGTPQVIIKHGVISDDTTQFHKFGRLLGSRSPGQARMKAAVFGPMTTQGRLPVLWTAFSESPAGVIMKALDYTPAELEASGISPLEIADMYLNKREDHVLLAPSVDPRRGLERGPEVGATPIETEAGLLMFYCPPNPGPEKQWCVGALLLDPVTYEVTGRIDDLIVPTLDSELHGIVNKVAFPSGGTYDRQTGRVRVYYGAGDKEMRMAEGDMSQLLKALQSTGNTADNRARMAELYYEQFHRTLSEKELGKLTIRALSEPNWPY